MRRAPARRPGPSRRPGPEGRQVSPAGRDRSPPPRPGVGGDHGPRVGTTSSSVGIVRYLDVQPSDAPPCPRGVGVGTQERTLARVPPSGRRPIPESVGAPAPAPRAALERDELTHVLHRRTSTLRCQKHPSEEGASAFTDAPALGRISPDESSPTIICTRAGVRGRAPRRRRPCRAPVRGRARPHSSTWGGRAHGQVQRVFDAHPARRTPRRPDAPTRWCPESLLRDMVDTTCESRVASAFA